MVKPIIYSSNNAVQVMSVVKGLMKTGMTICATIHSPTPFCFRLFDRMMILLRGHMAYAGPNGTCPSWSQAAH